ncbi:MAG: hypothetical protein LUH08_07270 [Ruminococcus sp.]|nr:hypothetical protein [Ruminococcus sp.]
MNSNKNVLIAGGDCRQTYLARFLLKAFDKIYTIGFNLALNFDRIIPLDTLDSLDEKIDVLILPPIATNDGATVNTPFYDKNLYIDEVLKHLNKGAKVYGGKLSDKLKGTLSYQGFCPFDYLLDERFIVDNTLPTAEGALMIALEETPFVLYGSKAAVLGYGRVGATTASLFKNVGAEVFVFDRKEEKRKIARIKDLNAFDFYDDRLFDCDIIINTVPCEVLTKERLKKVKREALIIDLASKPGGVDLEYAKLRGLNVIWALSLPGRVAPVTSGEIIGKTIISDLTKGGV